MTRVPTGNHSAKAYAQNNYFSTQDFKRMQRKHPKAVAQAINFNDQKAAVENGNMKALPQDAFISGAKKGIKDKAKGLCSNITTAAKNHKVLAGIIGAVTAAGAAFGIYKGVQHHKNSHQA